MCIKPTQVTVTNNIAKSLSEQVVRMAPSKILVLADDNTHHHCYPLISSSLSAHELFVIPPGEQYKNLQTCHQIWSKLTALQMDRSALVVNLGGGVIGDMGGFCAATFKRGIEFVNVPTTLLAQVDASIGGKLGVDFDGYKNHIGLFKEPAKVLISTEFLTTLPYKELRSGFAEVLKHALIKDAAYWQKIHEFDWEHQNWTQHINHSIDVKEQVVEEDPQEKGLRKILNFGHTIGHAVERFYLSSDTPLLHGEAIAVGMVCEAFLSRKYTALDNSDLEIIGRNLSNWFGKVTIRNSDFEAIATNAVQDKKNRDGVINCTLLTAVGQAVVDQPIGLLDIIESLDYYSKY